MVFGTCIVCGARFRKLRSQKTCSEECSREAERLYQRSYWSRYYEKYGEVLRSKSRERYAAKKAGRLT